VAKSVGKLANSNPFSGDDNFADGNPDGVPLRQPYRAARGENGTNILSGDLSPPSPMQVARH